ncbi:hypothetical protein ACH5RR_022524 [Cinchona calisaya]|uniref:Fe2OG dioxygenase domain-containing protein n=1 Tax=Cinchona calisaya TaxID=153742 RepID=A0ABD2Z820_9GENT
MSSELGGGCMELMKNLGRDEILEILSQGLCEHCDATLLTRIQETLAQGRRDENMSFSNKNTTTKYEEFQSTHAKPTSQGSKKTSESVSWKRQDGLGSNSSTTPYNNTKRSAFRQLESDKTIVIDFGLSEDEELIRFQRVGRKKDLCLIERINGKPKNVLQGLELHTQVFNSEEQKKIVDCVLELQRKGQNGQLRERTYSEPRKWMRGKGRVTIQFGCCYNYAMDKNGNPPGIVRDEKVDPLPPLFKKMIKRMVRWQVLPPDCVPDSCIVNIYDEGDCIPPHIDHHDFVRPFCTVSFLSECNILFGTNLKIISPGEFAGPFTMPLPLGSVLILNGNGADVAKHCVPAVPSRRISITFRKMHPNKTPYMHILDPQLSRIKPLEISPSRKPQLDEDEQKSKTHRLSKKRSYF